MIKIIGGGLAGCEAAFQVSRLKEKAIIYEMRPVKMTPAHKTGTLAEIVCSNSLHSNRLTTASGVLKYELRALGSKLIEIADKCSVPAGGALAVNRKDFAEAVEEAIEKDNNIEIVRKEITDFDNNELTIIASGPLSSEIISSSIFKEFGNDNLFFYDAIAPIVEADSIDYNHAFFASRYEDTKVDTDYLNLPMDKECYENFVNELCNAEKAELHNFEKKKFFECCLPVEEIASRGIKTLAFGPLKPVGLRDPETGRRPYAVVQLRKEDKEATAYNIVGFQTNLTYKEQKRVFRLIPGLSKAEFIKLGQMHRNTYINSPKILNSSMQTKKYENIFIAGQLTGVEGYTESISSGLLAGINSVMKSYNKELFVFPKNTVIGALFNKITSDIINIKRGFQPENSNFGILPNREQFKKNERKQKLSEKAIESVNEFIKGEKWNSILKNS